MKCADFREQSLDVWAQGILNVTMSSVVILINHMHECKTCSDWTKARQSAPSPKKQVQKAMATLIEKLATDEELLAMVPADVREEILTGIRPAK